MANLERMKARRKEITDEQSALVSAAENEDRQFSDEERQMFKTLQDEFEPLQDQISSAETAKRNEGLSEGSIKPETNGDGSGDAPEMRSLGDQFVESEGYQGLRARGTRGTFTTGSVELRTLLSSGSSSGGDAIIADNQPGIRPLRLRRLTVADLLLSGSTDSNSVTYVEEQTFTNAADTVTEGTGAKPESTLVFNIVAEAVQKIAHWIPVTDEMLEDVSQLRSFIDNRLTIGVQLAEEDQLLNGTGTPPDISGILDRTGLQTTITTGAATSMDSVFGMMTAIRNAFYEPNGMVIHPSDWGSTEFRLAKDQADQYYGGGPFTGAYGNGGIAGDNIWGLRVVVTPAIATGTVLVGDFNQAQIFRKSGITVEASNSHSDYFIYNKTAIRAEERLALAVYAPGAFGVVDLTP